jgi:hypothetical protein
VITEIRSHKLSIYGRVRKELSMKHIGLVSLLVIGLLGASCSSGSGSVKSSAEPKTLPDLAKAYLGEVRWRLPGRDAEDYAYLLDRPTFLRLHRDEMIKTLEVVETPETPNVAVAFVRYSIGATVYREAVWMRRIEGQWRATLGQYFSDYEKDPFGDGKPDEAKALIKRVTDWKGQSPKSWW